MGGTYLYVGGRAKKYGKEVAQQIEFLWDAFGLCGKRLKEAMPDMVGSLIRRGHFSKDDEVHKKLLQSSRELDTQNPGHFQIDLVGHDGGNPNGHFARSLNAMELSSGWIESRVVINEAQRWTKEALASIKASSPVAIPRPGW
jgi:hypothetical protein